MIPQTFIDEVQTRTDIVEVISGYIPLRKTGRNFKALCPFHGEKTASFIVSPQKQIFHCFGCGQGGGVIQFLMAYEKVTFVETIEILARRLGLEIPFKQGQDSNLKATLYEAVAEASWFFHNNLLAGPAGGVRQYLEKRGLNLESIKQFRLGWAAAGRSLLKHLRQKGFTLQVLEKASLVISQKEGYRDLFRERIIFPIFDVRGRAVGFGARTLRNDPHTPKYINSLENPLYSKRQHLYGLNFSKEQVTAQDCLIVAEGYLDMITPFSRGIKNIVASSGTALTPEQIRVVRRYTSNITLLFDSDQAGQTACLRALDLALEADLKVNIVDLPKGFDPDSLIRQKGKETLLQLLELKQDFFDYKIGILQNTYDIETIEGKTRIAGLMLATIAKLNSEVTRYEYIKKLAAALKIKEEIVIAEFKKISNPPAARASGPAPGLAQRVQEPLSITEKVLLKFMLTNQRAISLVKKNVREEDFTSRQARKAVSFIFGNYKPGQNASHFNLLNATDSETSAFISQVLMDDDIPLDKEQFKSSIIKLRKRRAQTLKDKLRSQIEEAEACGDKERLRVLITKYGKINSEARNG